MITELLAQIFRNEFIDYLCPEDGKIKSFQQSCDLIEELFGEFYGIMKEKEFEEKLRAFIEVQKDKQKKKKEVLTVGTHRSKMNLEDK